MSQFQQDQDNLEQTIQRRSWGRFYVAPVLLDHRSYKRLLFTLVLLGVGSFVAGYVSGFEKAEESILAELDSTEMLLPEIDTTELAKLEAEVPEELEPGATIDVDSADAQVNEGQSETAEQVTVVASIEVEDKTESIIEQSTFADDSLVVVDNEPAQAEQLNADRTLTEPAEEKAPANLGIGGPASEEPVASEKPSEGVQLASLSFVVDAKPGIADDATAEDARYSIQAGMYSSFNNAANRVEQLLNDRLNAYINEYKNKNEETRYNVRFGYFASFTSAKQALTVFEQGYNGSGYIVRVNR